MDKQNKLTDEQFEEMFRQAVIESFEEDMNELPPDSETERMYPYSKRHIRRMNKLFGIKRRKKVHLFSHRVLKIAAAILLVFTLSFSALLINDEVRAAIGRMFITWHEEFTRFVFGGDENVETVPYTVWRPTNLPEGFYESFSAVFGTVTRVVYANEAGDEISLRITIADGSVVDVDNEYMRYYAIENDGITYHVFVSITEEVFTIILWETSGFSFMVNGNVDSYELLKMAFSVIGVY